MLGFAISCLKLLLVTHFHLVFPQDPDQLGRRIFLLGAVLAVLPNAVIGIHLSLHGMDASKVVQLASKGSAQSLVPYNFFYVTLWAVLCVIMLLVALTYIPYHLESSRQKIPAIKAAESDTQRKSTSLKKLLLVFSALLCFHVAVIVHNISDLEETDKLFPLYLSTGMPTMVLVMFVLEVDIGKYICKTVVEKHTRLEALFFRLGRSARVSSFP